MNGNHAINPNDKPIADGYAMMAKLLVTKLCKTDGGITVYVTPEEWRQQIGEKEWLEMRQYQTPIEIQNYPKGNFIFNGKEYFPTSIANRRIVKYSGFERINKFTEKNH